MMEKCFIINVQMIVIFAVLVFHNVVDQVESSRRFFRFVKLYEDSDGLKSHVTLINELASVGVPAPLPAPSLVQLAVHSVTEKVGVLVVRSRILAELPLVVSAGDSESPSGSPNVLVIVICSLLLAGVLIGLIWFICAKSDQDCGTMASVSSAPLPANGHGGGVSKPATHPLDPPLANARGDGCKAKPSNVPVPLSTSIANGLEGAGSKPTPHPGPSIANGLEGAGSKPSNVPIPPSTSIANGLKDAGSKPTPHPGPSIAKGLEGAGCKPSNVPVPPPVANGGPSAPPIAMCKSSTPKHSSIEPRVKTDLRNAPIELETRHPIRVTEPGESSAGPSRLSEVGLIPFSYKELRDSTDDFSRANFLGEGGFAKVYKGSLSKDRKVAVKVLKNENSTSEKEFRNEVDIISRARHRNIVSLVGYCITETKRLIVYEFVENRSLHDHLRGGKDIQVMDWAIRIKIARGASKGLAYLHEECGPQKIIHRDVKPANILLDFSFVPKVADFGISKLCPVHSDSLIATYIIGSKGFMDPVYFATKELSSKSDVYAFGVVLLMLISGQIDLDKVHGLKSELSRVLESSNFHGITDERLNNNYNVDEMTRMVTCADACLRREPKDRPDMSQISRVLENIVSPTDLRIKTMPRQRV